MSQNVGSAILIVGSIWLHFVYGLDIWLTVILCVGAICLTTYPDRGYAKLMKQLLEARIKLTNAKARQLGAT